ncbi:BamA/TamA family outer membrane protein, partial [Rhodoblastus sp.]|uniref:BamA/TamA family outer membrane protein n=1 Tax=Rhodoblastus sp. TaxID=1962975 RepID=UPI003F977658
TYLGYSAGQALSCSYMNSHLPGPTPGAPKQTYAANGVPIQQSPCISLGGDSAFNLRSSVGVGLIWASPMGPIRFNYSLVLTKQTSDVTQAFSFSGGAQF